MKINVFNFNFANSKSQLEKVCGKSFKLNEPCNIPSLDCPVFVSQIESVALILHLILYLFLNREYGTLVSRSENILLKCIDDLIEKKMFFLL